MSNEQYYGTYQRLGVTIWASNREVLKAVYRLMISPHAKREALKYRNQRHKLYRRLLGHHKAAQLLAKKFAL